jgi:serine/arginine repetitive matrix protein 2
MTESTVSRMSNLSDFPAPPPQHMTPAHMSLLSSYFQEAVAEREVAEDESAVTYNPRIGERF